MMCTRILLQGVIMFFIADLILSETCPPMKFGSNCQQTCDCEWKQTTGCDRKTGECQCNEGYTGSRCEADVNECLTPDPRCNQMNMYCQNTVGSYDCFCRDGFIMSALGNCVPCPEFKKGPNCSEVCNCVSDQSLYCDATCICKAGWTGPMCDKNVDDCKDIVCPAGTRCFDRHRGYDCKCRKDQILIGGKCQEFYIDMVTANTSPGVGELVTVYILYNLPTLSGISLADTPAFLYQVLADESVTRDLCNVDFKNESVELKNTVEFSRKIGVKLTRQYNYYLSMIIWFNEARESTLRVRPIKNEHDELLIVFDVRSKTQAEIHCMSQMSIEHVGVSMTTPVKYRRQSYNSFELKLIPTKDCTETPKIEWKYYYIQPYVYKLQAITRACMSDINTEEVKIDDNIIKAGESAISDHRSLKEILPRGTLRMGVYLMCVKAYVHNNKRYSAGTCGFIEIVTSYIITGSLIPDNERVVWTTDYDLDIIANFTEPDTESSLRYQWTCTYEHETNTQDKGDCFPTWSAGKFRDRVFHMPRNVFERHYRHTVQVVVSLLVDPTVTETATIYFEPDQDGEGEEFLPMLIKCQSACGRVIAAHHSLILTARLPYRDADVIAADMDWSIKADGKNLSLSEIKRIVGYPTYRVKAFKNSILFTLDNSLKPGVKYKISLHCHVQLKSYFVGTREVEQHYKAFAEYAMETESPPQGNGCLISPNEGEAVFTRFTLVCKDYVDPVARLPLTYKLFQLELLPYGKNLYDNILIAYSGSGTMENITLASKAKKVGVSTVRLRAKVRNVKGAETEVMLTVNLTTLDQKQTIEKIGSIKIESGGQEDARIMKNIATVLAADSTASASEKMMVRKDLLNNIHKLDSESADSIELVTAVLSACTEKEEEIEASGLDSGMTTAFKLAKYIGKLGTADAQRIKKVALAQVNALSRLLYVASVVGESISVMKVTEIPSATTLKEQNIHQSKLAMTSFGNIASVMLDTITNLNKPVKMSNHLMEFTVALQKVDKDTSFKVESDDVNFYLPTAHSGVLMNEIVESELEVFKRNPYGWTTSNVHGNLPVVKVNLVRQSGKHEIGSSKGTFRFSKPADIFLEYNASSEETEYSMLIKVVTYNNISYISMSSCVFMSVRVFTEKATVMHIASPDNLKIMVKAKYTNVISYFDNLADEDMVEMPLSIPTSTETSKGKLYRNESLFFLPQLTKQQLKRNNPYYRMKISLKLNQELDTSKFTSLNLSVNFTKLGHDEPGEFYNVTIKATPHVMSCLHFDEEQNDYISNQCAISMFSSLGEMYCRCVVAAAFTGSVLILPRLINPLDIGLFLEIFKNPLVVSMVIAMWLIYFALIYWGRLRDKEDKNKRAVTVLDDNKEDHIYVYLIGVVTGWSASSATSSNVFIYLKGTFGQSENHVLQDTARRLFESGAENWFMLTTKDDVGELISVVVWTDFTGAFPSCWISVHFGRGRLLAEVPAFRENEYYSKWKLQIIYKGHNDIRNEHLWFGIIAKTSYNKFTRVRRLTTGLSLLQALMILNLMFFGIRDKDDPGQFIEILDQQIHVTSVMIGVQTSFIIFWLGIGISMLFNRVSPYPKSVKDSDQKLEMVEDLLQRKQMIHKLQAMEIESGDDNDSDYDAESVSNPVDERSRKSIFEQTSRRSIHEQMLHKSINELTLRKVVREQIQRKAVIEQMLRISTDERTQRKYTKEKMVHKPTNAGLSKKNGANKNENSTAKVPRLQTGEDLQSSPTDVHTFKPEDESETKPKRGPKAAPANGPFMLPWWFIYVTWTLLAVFNIFLAYYIMLYGLSLGYDKSVDWALAFFTGFFMNVLIIQPVKVAFMVLLLVLIFKQGHTFKEHAPVAKLNEGIMLVQDKKLYNRKYKSLTPKVGCKAPVHTAEATSVLERLIIEGSAREMLRDLFLYSIFTISVILVTHGNMNVQSQFLQTQHTKNLFLGFPIIAGEEVKRVEDMWDYLKKVVAPHMTDDRMLITAAHDIYPMGTARLRQVRTKNDASLCGGLPDTIKRFFDEQSCAFSPYFSTEESQTYIGTWDVVSNVSKDDLDDSPYIYRSAKELNAASFIGQHGFYSGGGYVLTFDRDDLQTMETKLTELYNSDWINQLTRCLFVEFTLYNPGSDHFTNVIIAFEFDNFGAIFPYVSIHSAVLFSEERKKQVWLQLSEGYMTICVIFYTIIEVQALLKQGIRLYFSSLWKCLEVATIVLTCAVGILFFLRYAEFMKILKDLQKYGRSHFLNFQVVFEIHELLHISLAMLGALVIFKMLKVTAFNPFVSISFKTFLNSKIDLFGMSVSTVILILIFACTGQFLFGKQLKAYMSIDRSILAMLFFILAEPDYESLVSVDIYLGRLYFFVVIMISQYIIVNFFCSVLREGFELTRYMAFQREKEIIKYMLTTAKFYAGFGPRNVRPVK